MDKQLGLGKSSAKGERGITKRLDALSRQTALRGDRLLDVGCGDGVYTVRLADGFSGVEAIDIQEDRLALFTERIKDTPLQRSITVRAMSAAELDYPDASFDLVTAIEVMEHVAELPRTLAEIHRVLRPGGRLCITTPNRWFPFETHGVLYRGRRYPSSRAPFVTWVRPVHRRFSDARTFTAAELRQHLAEAGLRTLSVDYMMPPFDRSGIGRRIRDVTDRIERSPLSFFGMTLIVTAEKPA
ncbi:Methyltransferase domain-containing protein [Thermomonospora echinospora]|uniref:Methyltransferase domain-containing protein n=1 Tax=Thermomonospora echinospora TaxID=1992 RepID=A0A1H6AG71_9ACTN|nr:class I SAM-dependent methyltransferase [Thermomonospora echinospora]SEG46756.1 Methyltransferase domain-containing protein [Thermomonospora echinospora]